MLGVLEGFYGKPWSPASRLRMTDCLPALGIDAYLYAPKADSNLRKGWRASWPKHERDHLELVAARSAKNELAFHLGLSPFELYRDYNRVARAALQTKVGEIVDLGVTGVALLFDDMPGDLDSLAARQAEICGDVRHWVGAGDLELRVCPTYYSDDPILDEIFGHRPNDYLNALYADLDDGYEVFWTGPEVCSRTVTPGDLVDASRVCRGNLALWDNYPVNDSRARSPHIYVGPLEGRSAALDGFVSSHWCNAMNQPALSLPALASLPALYGALRDSWAKVLQEAGVDEGVIAACEPLATGTLDSLGAGERAKLESVASRDTMASSELRDWLAGAYEFDPECLTC